jgi:hypothetical protein
MWSVCQVDPGNTTDLNIKQVLYARGIAVSRRAQQNSRERSRIFREERTASGGAREEEEEEEELIVRETRCYLGIEGRGEPGSNGEGNTNFSDVAGG